MRATLAVVLLTAACTTTTLGGRGTAASHAPSTTPSAAPSATSTTSAGNAGTTHDPTQPVAQFHSCAGLLNLGALPLPSDRKGKLDFGCAKITVPLDYAHPDDGKTVGLQLVRVHWTGGHPVGSLLMNPGGPGDSGILAGLGIVAEKEYPVRMLQSFDLIAFDPRGVFFSTPISCLGDEAERDRVNGLSPDVTTPAGFAQAKATATQIAQQCTQKYGADLAQFNTVQTAHDLDQIRQAVGDDTMNYLGFSYGTELGSIYAHLFPDRVRVAVLDGAVDPLTSDLTRFGNQIKGFEDAFDQFAAWCVKHSPCESIGKPRQAVYDLVKTAEANPIPSSEPGETRKATPSYVLTGVLYALYSQPLWKNLGDALISARKGDSRGLLGLADQYNQRFQGSGYTNIADANTTIGCNDSEPGPSDEVIRMTATKWTQQYPMFGNWNASALFSCQQWQPVRTPVPLPSAPTKTKVLVIGNLHDPATPYQGAIDLAKAMGNAEVLTWDGEGHTSYLQGSSCIDDYVENYLIDEKLPPEHKTCPR